MPLARLMKARLQRTFELAAGKIYVVLAEPLRGPTPPRRSAAMLAVTDAESDGGFWHGSDSLILSV
jgi:hypothetical protein